MTYPWNDLTATWYAALEHHDGTVFGVARRTPGPGSVAFDVLGRATGAWLPTTEGPGYFTGIGGVTSASPITEERALELIAALTG